MEGFTMVLMENYIVVVLEIIQTQLYVLIV